MIACLPPKQTVFPKWCPGNKLEGDVEDIVSLQAQTSPYFAAEGEV